MSNLPGAFDPALLVFDFLTGGTEVGKERKQQIADVTAELIKALRRRSAARVALGRAVHLLAHPQGNIAPSEIEPALLLEVEGAEAAVNALVERLEELL